MGTIIKGKLVRQGTNIMVELPTRKGTAKFPIPEKAKCFRDADADDGLEADVERDNDNRIVKVTIPGMTEVQPHVTMPKPKRSSKKDGNPMRPNHPKPTGTHNVADKDRPKASPTIIGEPFHNAYTFIRFETQPIGGRAKPTLQSVDEMEGRDRLTGVIELRVSTISPLMSCDPTPVSEPKARQQQKNQETRHRVYRALTIGNDVIVPATGVRGALRTLLTILTSGTLGYVDETAYLIQGRDVKLGTPENPDGVELGEVVQLGGPAFLGRIRLGKTKLVKLTELAKVISWHDLNSRRKPDATPLWVQIDDKGTPINYSEKKSDDTPWRLRLSGPVVGGRKMEDKKREAIFLPCGPEVSVPSHLWVEYSGRNVFSVRPTLKKNDLVWLEPRQANGTPAEITSGEDIESLQWARWGKRGHKLSDKIADRFHPDSWKTDGHVDQVTDLFGQVSDQKSNGKAITFSGRLMSENLMFADAKQYCQQTVLAPLMPPHPGCLAFYRDNDDPDTVDFEDMLRGYKVYRTTSEQGAGGPWNYPVQGVYNKGKLGPAQQKVNKTVELVPPGQTGMLCIAFHAFSKRELALLVQACSVPWRLGGGKPFGLGHCSVEIVSIIDEFGQITDLPTILGTDWQLNFGNDAELIRQRVQAWTAIQQNVKKLRYPRGVKGNSRGGHAWFQYHARPRAVSAPETGKRESGLTAIRIDGELKDEAVRLGMAIDPQKPLISGQTLPMFNQEDLEHDVLFGYDMIGIAEDDDRNLYHKFELFDEVRHDLSKNESHPNQQSNAQSRSQQKKRRRNQ